MKSARIVEVDKPLQVQELETPKPKGQQVLIEVQSSGVCHSDIHLWEGGYEGPHGLFLKTTDRGVKYPLTPGHEVAGTIDSLGEQVDGFSKNEKVLVFPWIGEGLCPACRMGKENLCDKPRSLGIYTDGGYSEYVLVPSYKYLVKIGDCYRASAQRIHCVTKQHQKPVLLYTPFYNPSLGFLCLLF
jgi:alcohol dehydrogenase, propanol-preferring